MKKYFWIILSAMLLGAPLSIAAQTNVERQFLDKQELLENPGFENGKAGWGSTGGSFTLITGANALAGSSSARFNSSASGQIVYSKSYTVPKGLQGLPCLGYFKYITTESTNKYRVRVVDGSSNVLGYNDLDAVTSATIGYAPFICPTSGTVRLEMYAQGDSADIDFDFGHLGGDTRLADISQAQFMGAVVLNGCAGAWATTSVSFADFPVQTTCTYTTSGMAQAPATMIPAIKFASLPAGEYILQYEGRIGIPGTGEGHFQFSDGTNNARETSQFGLSSPAVSFNGLVQSISYTSAQTNVTLSLRGKSVSGTISLYGTTANPGVIKVYKMPTVNETGLRVDSLGWHVDANISGANPSLSLTSISSYTGIEHGSLALTNNTGNGVITAQIPCSSTNAPTGTTCSSGNESVGINFNLPAAGDVLACVSFSNYMGINSGSQGIAENGFEIVETPSNAQTILQEGKSRINSRYSRFASTAGVEGSQVVPFRLCGNFTFSSAGNKTLRLMYETEAQVNGLNSNFILADANAVDGKRDIHWEVYPINYQSGALPVFKGQVTTEISGQSVPKYFNMNTICSAGTCTLAKNNGFSSCTFSSTGVYNCAFTNAYSDVPNCILNGVNESGAASICRADTANTTSSNLRVNCFTSGSVTAVNAAFWAQCFGPK